MKDNKTLKHFGIPGMRWGVRRNRSVGVGTNISSHSPLRGRMNPVLGKTNRGKIKGKVDEVLGKSIGLKKVSELKNKEVTMTWKRGQFITTMAFAVIGAWKVGEWLASN